MSETSPSPVVQTPFRPGSSSFAKEQPGMTIGLPPQISRRPDTLGFADIQGPQLIGKFKAAVEQLQKSGSYLPTVLDGLVLGGITIGDFSKKFQALATEIKHKVFGSEKSVVRDRTAAWWLGYIRKEWTLARQEGKEHDSLAGAAGVFGFSEKPEGFGNNLEADGDVLRPTQVTEFITQSMVGLWESQRMMNEYLGWLWVSLETEGIIPKLESRAFIFTDRLNPDALGEGWNKLVRTYGFWSFEKEVADENGTSIREWKEHLTEFRAFLDTKTGKESVRTEKECSSIRFIVYNKSRGTGKWETKQVMIKLANSSSRADSSALFDQVQAALSHMESSPEKYPSIDADMPADEDNPLFEVALVVHQVGDTEDTVPIQLDQKGVALRAPVARLVIDYQNHDRTAMGDPAVAPGKIRALRTQFPHYATNEDGARNIERRLRQKLREKYPQLQFEYTEDRTKPRVIRREVDSAKKLETVEVSSEVSLSKAETALLKLARNADAYRIAGLPETKRDAETPLGFAQAVTLATSTITRQPGYMCISPDADLQIGFCPWTKEQVFNVVSDEFLREILSKAKGLRKGESMSASVYEQLTADYVFYLKRNNQDRTFGPVKIAEELADYSRYTSGQIADGRRSMALLPIADTYTPDLMKKVFDTLFPKHSRHVQRAKAQISSVFHDSAELFGKMQFTTAGALYAKLAVGLRSTPDEKAINLRHRYDSEDLAAFSEENSSASNEQVEEMATWQTDRILKIELRLRLILVNIAYAALFSDPKTFDAAKVQQMMAEAIAEVVKQ